MLSHKLRGAASQRSFVSAEVCAQSDGTCSLSLAPASGGDRLWENAAEEEYGEDEPFDLDSPSDSTTDDG